MLTWCEINPHVFSVRLHSHPLFFLFFSFCPFFYILSFLSCLFVLFFSFPSSSFFSFFFDFFSALRAFPGESCKNIQCWHSSLVLREYLAISQLFLLLKFMFLIVRYELPLYLPWVNLLAIPRKELIWQTKLISVCVWIWPIWLTTVALLWERQDILNASVWSKFRKQTEPIVGPGLFAP